MAEAHRELDQPAQALAHARHALALAHAGGLAMLQANALTHLGAVNLRRQRLDDAVRDGREAIRMHEATGCPAGEARAQHVLGDALDLVEGDEAALPHWQRAYELYADIGMTEATTMDAIVGRHQEWPLSSS